MNTLQELTKLEQNAARENQHTVISNADKFPNAPEALRIAYRAGLPEAASVLIQRVLNLETEVMLLQADIRSLNARLAALENKS